jgi:hypothetical protein
LQPTPGHVGFGSLAKRNHVALYNLLLLSTRAFHVATSDLRCVSGCKLRSQDRAQLTIDASLLLRPVLSEGVRILQKWTVVFVILILLFQLW